MVNGEILLQPDELWNFFLKNLENMYENDYLIAKGDEGEEILISLPQESGTILSECTFCIVVRNNGVIIYEYEVDETDCEVECADIYSRFIDNYNHTSTFGGDIEIQRMKERKEREMEIDLIVENFVYDMMDDGISCSWDPSIDLSRIKEKLLLVLADEGLEIYRPSYVKTSKGVIFKEFPYE